jgi:hypothetical protein
MAQDYNAMALEIVCDTAPGHQAERNTGSRHSVNTKTTCRWKDTSPQGTTSYQKEVPFAPTSSPVCPRRRSSLKDFAIEELLYANMRSIHPDSAAAKTSTLPVCPKRRESCGQSYSVEEPQLPTYALALLAVQQKYCPSHSSSAAAPPTRPARRESSTLQQFLL